MPEHHSAGRVAGEQIVPVGRDGHLLERAVLEHVERRGESTARGLEDLDPSGARRGEEPAARGVESERIDRAAPAAGKDRRARLRRERERLQEALVAADDDPAAVGAERDRGEVDAGAAEHVPPPLLEVVEEDRAARRRGGEEPAGAVEGEAEHAQARVVLADLVAALEGEHVVARANRDLAARARMRPAAAFGGEGDRVDAAEERQAAGRRDDGREVRPFDAAAIQAAEDVRRDDLVLARHRERPPRRPVLVQPAYRPRGEGAEQGASPFDGRRHGVRFGGELQRQHRIANELRRRLRRQLARKAPLAQPVGFVALARRLDRLPRREPGGGDDRRHRGGRDAPRALLLANVLAVKDVLGDAADRCGEVEQRRAQARVSVAERHLLARPAQVDVEGLLAQPSGDRGGQGIGAREVEVVRGGIPGQRAVGEDEQEPLGAVAIEPPRELLRAPGRRRRARRREEVSQRLASRWAAMLLHSPGLAARPVLSRNTSMARRRKSGLASFSRPASGAGAEAASRTGCTKKGVRAQAGPREGRGRGSSEP